MKRTLLLFSTILTSMTFAQNCSDLFISEYVEGWSNNKALEIYNPTAASIDLSQYVVIRYSNGSTTATSANAVQLTGSVAAHDVYVAVLDKQNPNGVDQEAPVWDDLAAKADGFYCPDYNTSNAFYWNGNDAVVLAKGTASNSASWVVVDIFGKIGENPGNGSDPETGWTSAFPYTGAGDGLTVDHSLIRKPAVQKGTTDPNPAYFIALNEYDSIPAVVDVMGVLEGNWNSLGVHDCDCNPAGLDEEVKQIVKIFPNPNNGEFTIVNANEFNSITIVNSLGQIVESISNNSKVNVSVDLKGRKGVYFVKLSNSKGESVTRKVISK